MAKMRSRAGHTPGRPALQAREVRCVVIEKRNPNISRVSCGSAAPAEHRTARAAAPPRPRRGRSGRAPRLCARPRGGRGRGTVAGHDSCPLPHNHRGLKTHDTRTVIRSTGPIHGSHLVSPSIPRAGALVCTLVHLGPLPAVLTWTSQRQRRRRTRRSCTPSVRAWSRRP